MKAKKALITPEPQLQKAWSLVHGNNTANVFLSNLSGMCVAEMLMKLMMLARMRMGMENSNVDDTP